MALVGKIMPVAMLLMSLLFMGFSIMNYATQRNYKALVNGGDGGTGLNDQLRELTNEVREQEQKLEQIQNKIALESASKRSSLVALEVKSRESNKAIATRREELEQLTLEHQRNINTLSTAQDDMIRLKGEADELRKEVEQVLADRNGEFETVTELTDKINQAEGVLRRLKERSEQLRGN